MDEMAQGSGCPSRLLPGRSRRTHTTLTWFSWLRCSHVSHYPELPWHAMSFTWPWEPWLLFLKPGIDLVPTNPPMVIRRELPGPGAIGYWELAGEGIEVGGSPEPREAF